MLRTVIIFTALVTAALPSFAGDLLIYASSDVPLPDSVRMLVRPVKKQPYELIYSNDIYRSGAGDTLPQFERHSVYSSLPEDEKKTAILLTGVVDGEIEIACAGVFSHVGISIIKSKTIRIGPETKSIRLVVPPATVETLKVIGLPREIPLKPLSETNAFAMLREKTTGSVFYFPLVEDDGGVLMAFPLVVGEYEGVLVHDRSKWRRVEDMDVWKLADVSVSLGANSVFSVTRFKVLSTRSRVPFAGIDWMIEEFKVKDKTPW